MTTAAKRARARRDPSVGLPPGRVRARDDLARLEITSGGIAYKLAPLLVPDGCDLELTMDGASILTLTCQASGLLRALADETSRMNDGITVDLDDVTYVLTAASMGDENQIVLTLEDQIAWRLRQFTRYMSRRRSRFTRAEFVGLLVDEAGRSPRKKLRAYIPELTDRQPIAGRDV